MKTYPIIKDHFTKSDCYKSSKKITPTGIQVHSVGAKGTLAARWKKSWNAPDRDVCAGYVIDTDAIYEILPEGKRCWLSGSGAKGNANNTHLGFEICEPLTKDDTPEVAADLYGKTLFLCVHLCRTFGIKPEKVQAHYELHALGLASNHSDVRHWWGKKGTSWEIYTMDKLRTDIAVELGVVPPIETDPIEKHDTIRKGAKGPTVIEMQGRLLVHGIKLQRYGADGDFGSETDAALREFQRLKGLTVDGICGAATWGALLEPTVKPAPAPTPEPTLYAVTITGLTSTQVDELLKAWPDASKAVM